MQKLEKSFYTMKYYMGMIITTLLLLILFVLPFNGPRMYLFALISLFTFAFLQFAYVSSKDPGIVKKSNKISFLRLNQYFE